MWTLRRHSDVISIVCGIGVVMICRVSSYHGSGENVRSKVGSNWKGGPGLFSSCAQRITLTHQKQASYNK